MFFLLQQCIHIVIYPLFTLSMLMCLHDWINVQQYLVTSPFPSTCHHPSFISNTPVPYFPHDILNLKNNFLRTDSPIIPKGIFPVLETSLTNFHPICHMFGCEEQIQAPTSAIVEFFGFCHFHVHLSYNVFPFYNNVIIVIATIIKLGFLVLLFEWQRVE